MSFIYKKNIQRQIKTSKLDLLFFGFISFSIFYFFNLENYNFYSTDFQVRYKPNGLNLINQIISLNFSEINFFNYYLIPELIAGFLLKISPNDKIFSLGSNCLNIILLFCAFYYFFKSLNLNNNRLIVLFFLIIFFSYIGNWIWCFWKLADIYFLFVFSLVFYFINRGIIKKNKSSFIIGFFFVIISLVTKPQGLSIILFYILSIYLFDLNKRINFYKFLIIFFVIYLTLFPPTIYFLIKMNIFDNVTHFMAEGYISGTIFYKFDTFLNEFSLIKNDLNQVFYYYYLFIKKVIYQLTFLRETYSIKHNIFLAIYSLLIYFLIIINIKYLSEKENLFLKMTILICFLSILLHSSLNTADEPNRHQLFNLTPFYVLASISFVRLLKLIKILN